VVTSCPGCFMALSKVYPSMFGELGFEVVQASQLLGELVKKGALQPGDGAGGRVFYHDPCHLTRGLGIYQEPRDLLEKVPGTELMNPCPEGSACCGFGGGVRLSHPIESIEISRREHQQVSAKGGDIIVTNCAGCRQNLIEGRPGDGLKVFDLAEYLLLSLGESVPRDDQAMIDLVNEAYTRACGVTRGRSSPHKRPRNGLPELRVGHGVRDPGRTLPGIQCRFRASMPLDLGRDDDEEPLPVPFQDRFRGGQIPWVGEYGLE
jgi:hypothetical protein